MTKRQPALNDALRALERSEPFTSGAIVPGAVLAGASGLLFGVALGTLLAVVSTTRVASAAFLISRAGARRPYLALAGRHVQSWTARIEQHGFLAIMYARLVPGAPFALVSYAAGATRIRLLQSPGATAIAATPRASRPSRTSDAHRASAAIDQARDGR